MDKIEKDLLGISLMIAGVLYLPLFSTISTIGTSLAITMVGIGVLTILDSIRRR